MAEYKTTPFFKTFQDMRVLARKSQGPVIGYMINENGNAILYGAGPRIVAKI